MAKAGFRPFRLFNQKFTGRRFSQYLARHPEKASLNSEKYNER